MARNKYPEETVTLILDVAWKLFLEQGYEHTSIQNIIENLGGLTKGAIYHHFKSKEDILLAVFNRQYENHDPLFMEVILNRRDISGLEKLREIFRSAINSSIQMDISQTAPNLLKNPKILALQMQGIVQDTVPQYVKPIVEQGIADGSIKTEYPQALAEVILVLINIWLNPLIFYAEPEAIQHRFQVFKQLLQGVGLDLVDDQMLERILKLYRTYSEKR